MRLSRVGALTLGTALVAGCSGDRTAPEPADPGAGTPTSTSTPSTTAPSPSPGEAETDAAEPERLVRPGDLDVRVARRTVEHLAGEIGPRHATSPAYRRAARWVEGRFEELGYDVRRQRIDVPGGLSWGVPVEAGRSVNVIAEPPGFDPAEPHLVVGAHLDTVPQAPGAEDNGSGVGVVLATAEAVRERRTRLPVVLVAFGAEEPRGDTDADHHYGSRAYATALPPRQRRAVRGMVSLDRVGVGAVVPVGSADESGSDPAQRRVLAAAERAGVAAAGEYNRSSDHWQFVQRGMPGVRLGSTPFAGYHNPGDVPSVVDDAQLRRAGRIVLAWLSRR